MENASQLSKRFKELFLNGKWIAGTNYKEMLSDVTWEQASTKVSSLNTIAALTFHVDYYVGGVLDFFEGKGLNISDAHSFDFDGIQSKEEWERLRNRLISNAEKFANHIEKMSEKQLTQVFVREEYGDYRRNIEGIIEHGYYHFGQISLIKKMMLASGQ